MLQMCVIAVHKVSPTTGYACRPVNQRNSRHKECEFACIGLVPEWYEAFKVEEGDALYLPPKERVKIW